MQQKLGRRTSDRNRKVLMGMASAATAASWNTLTAPVDHAQSPVQHMLRRRRGCIRSTARPAARTTILGLCFLCPLAALEAAAASYRRAAALPLVPPEDVALLTRPTEALQRAVLEGVSALRCQLRAALAAEVMHEKWRILRMASAAADASGWHPMAACALEVAKLTGSPCSPAYSCELCTAVPFAAVRTP